MKAPIYVFTGPTLSAADAARELDAIVLPPVSQGDVYRAVGERPWAIGIIDGYFERVPAVWHKEILWALSRGVHVFGSASMGALRAAELDAFGMVGVGAVFEAFKAGELEDDDEVAVVHGPAETGYLAGSEAMVNIRATLAAAAHQGVVRPATGRRLAQMAKALFYPERNLDAVLHSAAGGRLPRRELAALAAWLPTGRVDQKRDDALAMLRRMRQWREDDPSPRAVRFIFQHTDAWEQVRRELNRRPLDRGAGVETQQADALLEELLVGGAEWDRVRDALLARALAAELAASDAIEVSDELRGETREAFRREHGLLDDDALARWLEHQGLSPGAFDRLMRDDARVRRIHAMMAGDLVRILPDALRLNGRYGALETRAREKQRTLALRGLENPGLGDARLTEAALQQWYFEERRRSPVPADLDRWALTAGFGDADAFRRAALREFCYLRLSAAALGPRDRIPAHQGGRDEQG